VNPRLYYLHIPKVAGTSLSAVLRDHFAADSICPAQSWHDLGSQALETFSLVSGHYGLPGADLLGSADLVTVLRKPASQIVSLFDHMQRDLPPWSRRLRLSDLATERGKPFAPEVARFLRNKQAQHLGLRELPPDWRESLPGEDANVSFDDLLADAAASLPDGELLGRAQNTLDRAAIVSTTDHLRELMDLLCYRYGWPAIAEIPRRNPGSGSSPPVADAVEQLVQVDNALYAYATQRLRQDHERMLASLRERHGPVSSESGRREVDLLLDRNAEERFEKREPASFLEWKAGDALWGSGWHDRERHEDGTPYRWTGPSSTAHLVLPALRTASIYVELDVVACFRHPVEAHLKLAVDGREVQFFMKEARPGRQTLTGYFRHHGHAGPFCRWDFTFDSPVVPQAIDPANADTRTVGVALARISVRS
jgi:hypothetical protein